MLRDLFSNWNQPDFFDIDCKLTKDKLKKIIVFVESCGKHESKHKFCFNYKILCIVLGFHVVAMVSDLGGKNVQLHKALNISISTKLTLKIRQ